MVISTELRLAVAKLPYIALSDIKVLLGEFEHQNVLYWPLQYQDDSYTMIMAEVSKDRAIVWASIEEDLDSVEMMESLPKFATDNTLPFWMYDA